jgi:catalase
VPKSASAVPWMHGSALFAFSFEFRKVEVPNIRSAVVAQLVRIGHELPIQVAAKLGLPELPEAAVVSRNVAVPAADGVDVVGVQRFTEPMRQRGAMVEVLAPIASGSLEGRSGGELFVDRVSAPSGGAFSQGVPSSTGG